MFKTVATRHLAQSNLYRNKVILDFSHPSILPNKTQEKNKMFASKCDYISNVSIPTLKWAKNIVNTTFQPATTTHATRGMSQSLQQISAKFGHTWPSPNCACQFSVFQHECPIMFTFKSVKSYRAERRKKTGIKTRHVQQTSARLLHMSSSEDMYDTSASQCPFLVRSVLKRLPSHA